MKRQAMDRLVAWKNDSGRRPLLLRGARQVGKTWLMKEFGRQEYERTAYVMRVLQNSVALSRIS